MLLQVLAAPPLPGPPTTFIVDASRPMGQVFTRFRAGDPMLTLDGWVRPSVPAEAPGTLAFAAFEFGATSGGAVGAPCAGCTFACRVDFGAWVNCSSPYELTWLSPGEHLFQVRAFAPDGTPDPRLAFYAWAISLLPRVAFAAPPPVAVNVSNITLSLVAVPGCALSYSMDGVSWSAVPGGGAMGNESLQFVLPVGLAAEGHNSLQLNCTLNDADASTAVVRHTWVLDTWPPVVAFAAGGLAVGSLIHADAATLVLAVNTTDPAGLPGASVAALQCRLVEQSSNATTPAPLFDWQPCAADPTGGPVALSGLLALPTGSYALQAFAVDAAGNAGDVVQTTFSVDTSLPLTPTVTVTMQNVTLAPAAASVLTTQLYYVTNVSNGSVLLSDGATNVTAGSFISAAAGAAGLFFVPTVAPASGETPPLFLGFDVQAADVASTARLGGDVVHVSITAQHVNVAPFLDASYVFRLHDVFSTGATLQNAETGDAVAELLSSGASDDNADAVGLAVIFADCTRGTWAGSNDTGNTWVSLCSASSVAPILVAGGAVGRLRFMPSPDLPQAMSSTEWAAFASLAFYAWDGADNATAGASCVVVPTDSAVAAAAAARYAFFSEVVQEALDAGTPTLCAPLAAGAYTPIGAYSQAAGVVVVAIYDASFLRGTREDSTAARAAAAAFATTTTGCPPERPSAVALPLDSPGAAMLLASGTWSDLPPPWTFEAWVLKRARLASSVLLSSAAYPAANTAALLLETPLATFSLGVRRIASDGVTITDTPLNVELPLDTWTHIAFVAGADGTLLLYVNGALASTVAPGIVPLPRGWLGSPLTTSAFAIDELRIWSVARTAQQLATARDVMLPPAGVVPGSAATLSGGLLSSFRFEEGCGVNASDTAAGNASAMLSGGAAWVHGVELACASVAGIIPDAGPPSGGGLVTLLGAGFLTPPSIAAVCVFSDGMRAPVVAATATTVACVMPPARSGSGSTRVSYADPVGGCHAADDVAYTFTAAAVTAAQPAQGPVAGGTLVTLSGYGLHAPGGQATCRFSPLLANGSAVGLSPARVVSASVIVCEAPSVPGEGTYLVQANVFGEWLPHAQRFTFTSAVPRVNASAPGVLNGSSAITWKPAGALLQSGPTTGGGLLRLLLPPRDSGSFATVALPSCGIGTMRPLPARLVGASTIECVAPARSRGPAPVALSVNGRDWESPGELGPRRFVSHSQPRPEVLLLEEAPARGGAQLTVLGSGGAAAWALSCVFGAAAPEVSPAADARTAHGLGVQHGQGVRCITPSVAPGFIALRIAGDGVASAAVGDGLQYLAREDPVTLSAQPRVLAPTGGTLVAVTGAHFTTTSVCIMGGAMGVPMHFVSSALVVCEAPGSTASATAIAVMLPQLNDAQTATSTYVNVANATLTYGAASEGDAADDTVCAFGSVRVAASSLDGDGAVFYRAVAVPSVNSTVPVGVGVTAQDIVFDSSAPASGPYTQPAAWNASSPLDVFPDSGSAGGLFTVTLYSDAAALVGYSPELLACEFGAELSPVAAVIAAAGGAFSAVSCVPPPSASARGGFVTLRLLTLALSPVTPATAQFMFQPRGRVTRVALMRLGMRGTDAAGKLRCGRRLWQGRPVAVEGVHLPGADGAACRFGAAVRPAGWVSSALLRCELPDVATLPGAQVLAALSVAAASAAADSAAWTPPSTAALFNWPRLSEEEAAPDDDDAC